MLSKKLYTRGKCLVEKVYEAKNFKSRLLGLFAFKQLQHNEGLLLKPCSSVHTFFMSYPLTLIFLKNNQVLKIVEEVKPFRVVSCRRSDSVVELYSQPLSGKLSVGDIIEIDE